MDEHPPSPVEAEPAQSDPPPSRRVTRRLLRLALQAALGLAVGLGVAEAAFRHRDGGAFPLVNVYEADPLRGVRLSPESATRVGRPGERVTEVRVNRDGYRGGEWPPPAPGQVLVVGDSISFGLGVDEGEALPAKLHAALPGAPAVLDASVPTYGPPEYLVTLDQVTSARRTETVVLVLDLVNDLAELDHPNTGRHTALDGWAARASVAPGADPGTDPGASSPLRTWAIQRSHAAFALWRWARTRKLEAAALPPEPGIAPLLDLAARVAASAQGIDAHRRDEARRAGVLAAAQGELRAARAHLVSMVRRYRAIASYGTIEQEMGSYLRTEGEPVEDVFTVYTGGCIPPPDIDGRRRSTQRRVRFSPEQIRDDVETLLRDYGRAAHDARGREILDAFARRTRAVAALAALPTAPLPPPPTPEPLPVAAFFARAQALAAERGARLVVAVTPLDAQVSPEARRRRGVSEPEAAALGVLSAEIAEAARAAGAVGVDAGPSLAAGGDAAFLTDGHLSAAGHEAVARAVAAALSEPRVSGSR